MFEKTGYLYVNERGIMAVNAVLNALTLLDAITRVEAGIAVFELIENDFRAEPVHIAIILPQMAGTDAGKKANDDLQTFLRLSKSDWESMSDIPFCLGGIRTHWANFQYGTGDLLDSVKKTIDIDDERNIDVKETLEKVKDIMETNKLLFAKGEKLKYAVRSVLYSRTEWSGGLSSNVQIEDLIEEMEKTPNVQNLHDGSDSMLKALSFFEKSLKMSLRKVLDRVGEGLEGLLIDGRVLAVSQIEDAAMMLYK